MAPDAKVVARQQVCEAVRTGGYGRRELIVTGEWSGHALGQEDLAAVASCGADAVLLPKVESAAYGSAGVRCVSQYIGPGTPGDLVHVRDTAWHLAC